MDPAREEPAGVAREGEARAGHLGVGEEAVEPELAGDRLELERLPPGAEEVPEPETDNRLLRMLARTPMRIVDVDDPALPAPDWVLTRPRLTGICGSEAKQVFFDYASFTSPDRTGPDGFRDNPMKSFISFPHVMGHEVVADVVAVGPEAANA